MYIKITSPAWTLLVLLTVYFVTSRWATPLDGKVRSEETSRKKSRGQQVNWSWSYFPMELLSRVDLTLFNDASTWHFSWRNPHIIICSKNINVRSSAAPCSDHDGLHGWTLSSLALAHLPVHSPQHVTHCHAAWQKSIWSRSRWRWVVRDPAWGGTRQEDIWSLGESSCSMCLKGRWQNSWWRHAAKNMKY